jgi:1-acyl-sn-glycerol-3-phosphate acyltransferase
VTPAAQPIASPAPPDPARPGSTPPEAPRPAPARPDLPGLTRGRLSFRERSILRIVRASFGNRLVSRLLARFQRGPGQAWIYHATKHLCVVEGLERTLSLTTPAAPGAPPRSILLVANHRSFFDLYVITARLVRAGMKNRIVFPVRSGFFYDRWLGLFVNFAMSFLAMYPPLFRDRRKATLNLACLDELGWLLSQGGVFVGMHPEGTRNQGPDPYELLPVRPGVGRLVHTARTTVVPVFINGLGNDILRQVRSNFDGTGTPIHVLYGEPIDFQDLLREPPSQRVFQQIAERTREYIMALGERERSLREQSLHPAAR